MDMNHVDVGQYWNGNAETWTRLSRAGYDVCRDWVNTPAFLSLLPDVTGSRGLDVGCGEGHNTRMVARRGADMTAIDIASIFLRHAREEEQREPLGIDYQQASAVSLPFADGEYDFAVSFMCLMDLPEQLLALAEIYRVLRPGGFLQFSITHPCFQTRHWEWVHDETGRRTGVVCGDYFNPPWGDIEEWTFGAAPPEAKEGLLDKFKVPRFSRTLTDWLNGLLDTGFVLERFCEPYPDAESVQSCPKVADMRTIALFLIIRCRKPA